MPTGVTSAWGIPINAVGGQINTMLEGDHPLTYEQSLTSYRPMFINGNLQSPLLNVSKANLQKPNAFGKQRKLNLNLKQLNRDLKRVTKKKKL